MIKRKLFGRAVCLFLLILYIPLTGFISSADADSDGIPANAEGRLAYIREKGVLTVATEPYFPPQEFIHPSLSGKEQYIGSDIELARRIAQRMGVELEIVPMNFSRVLTSVAEGECDLAISALSYTPDRASRVELSRGYHFSEEAAGSALLIRKENRNRIRSLSDLKGRNITAQRGSLRESLLAEQVFNYREFRRLPSVQDVYISLKDRVSDAACVDLETANVYLENNPKSGLMLVPDVVFIPDKLYEGDRIAARKDEKDLIAFVDTIIEEVVESGEYERWFSEYRDLAESLGY